MVVSSLISIGIDIGGTKISAAAVHGGQIISEVLTFRTPENVNDLLNTVLEAVEGLKNQYDAKFVGIATAGTVNIENSRVTGSTGNLPAGYADVDFKKLIEEKFGLTTYIENDANAAAYAEFKIGNASGDDSTIVLTLGTGIGGGIIIDSKLLRGKSGVAAEVGHLPICWDRKRRCTCGAWDCWEAYASGTGYAKNAREMAKEIPQAERTGILKDKDPDTLTTYDIVEALKNGDPFAKKVQERWEDLLLMGLTALVNIFDPNSVVLSGGMARFVNLEKLNNELEERAVISKVKLLPAKTENYAGLIGAAILATENLTSYI